MHRHPEQGWGVTLCVNESTAPKINEPQRPRLRSRFAYIPQMHVSVKDACVGVERMKELHRVQPHEDSLLQVGSRRECGHTRSQPLHDHKPDRPSAGGTVMPLMMRKSKVNFLSEGSAHGSRRRHKNGFSRYIKSSRLDCEPIVHEEGMNAFIQKVAVRLILDDKVPMTVELKHCSKRTPT